MSEEVENSIASSHAVVIEDVGRRWVAVRFVSRVLIAEQETRLFAVTGLRKCPASGLPQCADFISGGETWIFGYDPETNAQSSVWKFPSSSRPKTAGQIRNKTEVLLTVFFDEDGIVHHELWRGPTVNNDLYLHVLQRLRDAVCRKGPEKSSGYLQIYYDNPSAQSSQLVQHFLAKQETPQVREPPYSPDLAYCDFFCFSK